MLYNDIDMDLFGLPRHRKTHKHGYRLVRRLTKTVAEGQ